MSKRPISKAELEAYIADDFIPAMRKMLPVIAPLPEWQPIETAPKDGTQILGWYDGQEHLLVHWGYAHPGIRAWLDRYGNVDYTPTHWMPLPKPPLP